jgi:DNA-binding GntR family transcriptional regulator
MGAKELTDRAGKRKPRGPGTAPPAGLRKTVRDRRRVDLPGAALRTEALKAPRVAAAAPAFSGQDAPQHPLYGRRPPARQSNESLGDFAYRVMRDALQAGSFRPREHVREADLAAWLMISRTPVREAFHRLISEGLLGTGPWNGVMVTELSKRQLVQLYAVREALEGTAAALAAVHATKAEVQLMMKIAAKEARASADSDKLVTINGALHQTFYRASHNKYLMQSITTVVDALGLLRHSTFVLPGSAESAHREHVRIIRAIRDRNPGDAERWARKHVRHSLELRLRLPRSPSSD